MRSRVRPADPAYSTGACDDPSIGGSPEHSRAVADARPRCANCGVEARMLWPVWHRGTTMMAADSYTTHEPRCWRCVPHSPDAGKAKRLP